MNKPTVSLTMKFRSYNAELKTATSLFMNCFSNIKISRFDKDFNSAKDIVVPLVYGTRSRALKELENVNKTLKPPLLAVVKENISQDSQRMNETYSYKINMPDGHDILTKMRAVPINIEFTLSGIAIYEDDLDQIISNFIPFFKPDIFVSWKHPRYKNMEIKSQIVWDCRVNYQSPIDISEKDHEFYQFETTFTFKTWFFAGLITEEEKEAPLIKTINYTGNEFFEVGGRGFGMNAFYVVPTSIPFEKFIEMANNELIGKEAFEILPYPRIVTLENNDLSMCYPVMTRFTAATVKITLLDEDKSSAEYDPNMFNFNENSEIGDNSVWHIKTDINFNYTDDDTPYNYAGTSIWKDDSIDIKIKTSLSTNYDWFQTMPNGLLMSTPLNPVGVYTAQWRIEGDGENVTSLFSDNDVDYISHALSSVTWQNLTGKNLNVKRVILTSGDRNDLMPRAFVIEGIPVSGHRWIQIKKIRIETPWEKNETRYFDYEDDEQTYEALRITFGRPYSLNGDTVAIRNLKCYSALEISDAPQGIKSKRISKSEFEVDVRSIGDDNSKICMKSVVDDCSKPSTFTSSFGSAIEVTNPDNFALTRPSMEELAPVFSFPGKYVYFWYKGRKYGLSVGGNINKEKPQTITRGDQFPLKPANASMHVLTSTPGTPIYQYDAGYDIWFEIGNQTRSGFQTAVITNETGETEITLTPGNHITYSIDEYNSEFAIQYFTANIKSDVDGKAVLSFVSNDGMEPSICEIDVFADGRDVNLPFAVYGNVNNLVVKMVIEGTSVNSINISNAKITGKLFEGDYFNNPEEQEISVRNFLASF